MSIGIREETIDRDQNVSSGGYTYEAADLYPAIETLADLFRYGQSEFGRCTGKMYIDVEDGAKHIGYVFLKRMNYDRSDETFLAETWISMGEFHPATEARLTY